VDPADRPRLSHPHVRGGVLSTFTNRSSTWPTSADDLQAGTDLAILNYIATTSSRAAGERGLRRQAHVKFFSAAKTDIGYGLRPKHPLQQATNNATGPDDAQGRPEAEELRGVSPPSCRSTRWSGLQISGVEPNLLEHGRGSTPTRKQGDVALDHGLQPAHPRHLGQQHDLQRAPADGKISEPGNSPFSLTGQPSACGTAREVGTFAHRLPADMVVTNPSTAQIAEEIWQLPDGHDAGTGSASMPSSRTASSRTARSTATGPAGQQQHAGRAQHQQRDLSGLPQSGELHRRLGRLSDGHRAVRRPDPARAMWVEKEGAYGNAERRTSSGASWSRRRARRARPVAADGVLQALHGRRGVAGGDDREEPGLSRQDAVRRAVRQRQGRQVPAIRCDEIDPDYANDESQELGFYLQKGLFEEYAEFGRGKAHDLAPFDVYHQNRGLRWPVVDGKETLWRFREGYDPYVTAGEGVSSTATGRPGGHPRAALRAAREAGRGVRPVAGDRAGCSSTGIPGR
jgi:nitrate reductase (cytochrome)